MGVPEVGVPEVGVPEVAVGPLLVVVDLQRSNHGVAVQPLPPGALWLVYISWAGQEEEPQ